MLKYPGCETAEISRRSRLLIDFLYYDHVIDIEGGAEFRCKRLRDNAFDIICQKMFTKAGSTALVTEDEAAGPGGMHDAGAVVEAAVGAGAEDGADALGAAAGRPCGAEHVRGSLDGRAAERLGKDLLRALSSLGALYKPRCVQMYLSHRTVTYLHRPLHDNACNLLLSQDGHIHPFRPELLHDVHSVRQAPFCLRGPAVDNQFHALARVLREVRP